MLKTKYDYLIVGAGLFGGRLAEYKYYDMDDVIKSAFESFNNEMAKQRKEI